MLETRCDETEPFEPPAHQLFKNAHGERGERQNIPKYRWARPGEGDRRA